MLLLLRLTRTLFSSAILCVPAWVMAQTGDNNAPAPDIQPAMLSSAIPQVPLWRDVPWTETLDPDRRLNLPLSVGTTSSGSILNAVHLPDQGEFHYVLAEHEERDTHWGAGLLVQAIRDAAEWAARRFPGMRVGVGNLSVRTGGALVWSRSHHCGRDADLAFRYLNEEGQPVEAQGLHVVRSNLTVTEPAGWRVDVPRTWAIIEGLLVTHGGSIQWIFVSQPLKDALLEHAEEAGAPTSIIAMASNVLHQPGDSRPHDDHLHLRVFCTALEATEGCADRPPYWDHADLHIELLQARMREFASGLVENPEAAELFLERIRSSGLIRQLPELFSTLPHLRPEVQQRVMELSILQNDRSQITGLTEVAPQMTDEASQRLVVNAIRRLANNEDAEAFIPLLDYRTPAGVSLASLAAEALQRLRNPAVVVALASLTMSTNQTEAEHAARALCRMTVMGGPDGLCDISPLLGTAQWHDFWLYQVNLQGALPEDDEIMQRLQQASFVSGDVRSETGEWVTLLTHPLDWVRFSAERILCHAFGESLSPPEDSAEERQAWWSRRIRRR